MFVTREQLDEYFERFGWTYSHESDDTWITGVRTSVSAFRIMVRLTEHWVFFIINPFVVAPPNKQERLRVYYHALRYNLDMNFAKLGLDSDGDIFLAIELPTENFDYSHFVDSLDGLSHHASMIYAELFGLAHNGQSTMGRYDDEMDLDDELSNVTPDDVLNFLASMADDIDDDDDDDDDMNVLPNNVTPFNKSSDTDDIIIAGRRLKITDSEDGSARVELEDDDDVEADDSDNDEAKD